MKTFDECIPCITDQVRRISETITKDPELRERIRSEAAKVLRAENTNQPPPYFGREVQRVIREVSGNPDPYREFKDYFTRLALETYPHLKRMVAESPDPFREAVKVALAGNIIDFAAANEIRLLRTIDKVRASDPVVDHTDLLRADLESARTILYLADNAGETVMVRVLIERFPNHAEVTVAVRGGPVINDATLEDAKAAGLGEVAALISTEVDAPGILLEESGSEFREAFASADLIVAKGMGNFETLESHLEKKIYFLLLVKCPIVARDIGCKVGEAAVKYNREKGGRS